MKGGIRIAGVVLISAILVVGAYVSTLGQEQCPSGQGLHEINGVALFFDAAVVAEIMAGQTLAVFGQFTRDGDPVDGEGFFLAVNLSHAVGTFELTAGDDTIDKSDCGGSSDQLYVMYVEFDRPVCANGARIHYILPGTALVSFDIYPAQFVVLAGCWEPGDDLDCGDCLCPCLYHLPYLPVDPPGEGSVGFF